MTRLFTIAEVRAIPDAVPFHMIRKEMPLEVLCCRFKWALGFDAQTPLHQRLAACADVWGEDKLYSWLHASPAEFLAWFQIAGGDSSAYYVEEALGNNVWVLEIWENLEGITSWPDFRGDELGGELREWPFSGVWPENRA